MSFIGKTASVFGVVGLSAIATLGVVESAEAASVSCTGSNWVNTCPAGNDSFPSVAKLSLDLDFDGIADLKPRLSGPVNVTRGSAVDGTIETEIFDFTLTGDGFTVIAGDGNGNLVSDGPLFTRGQITEQSPGSVLADSFFDVFAEIQGTPFGPLRNHDAIRLTATLKGIDGLPLIVSVLDSYVGTEVTQLFSAGSDGIFNTSDDILRAQLVPDPDHGFSEVHTPVPEPLTILGSATALGFGAFFKKQSSRKRNKKNVS